MTATEPFAKYPEIRAVYLAALEGGASDAAAKMAAFLYEDTLLTEGYDLGRADVLAGRPNNPPDHLGVTARRSYDSAFCDAESERRMAVGLRLQ